MQGRTVLEALAAGNEPLPVAAVLAHVSPAHVSVAAARASLSRTLRRLWAAGLVELVTGHATRPTLTEQAAYWRSVFATLQASPDALYLTYESAQTHDHRASFFFKHPAAALAALHGKDWSRKFLLSNSDRARA